VGAPGVAVAVYCFPDTGADTGVGNSAHSGIRRSWALLCKPTQCFFPFSLETRNEANPTPPGPELNRIDRCWGLAVGCGLSACFGRPMAINAFVLYSPDQGRRDIVTCPCHCVSLFGKKKEATPFWPRINSMLHCAVNHTRRRHRDENPDAVVEVARCSPFLVPLPILR
jgi:hypothetical protein